MLKYSTYQSIYDKPQATRSNWADGIRSSRLSRSMVKIALLLIVLMLTGTGVVSAFAAASDGHKDNELSTFVVRPGDTLWEIAVDHKPRGKDTRVYVEAIKRINGLSSSGIQAGDTLILPD